MATVTIATVMVKRKLLVCGSAGFMMSNFIRYLFYMTRDTKEFDIVSVDKLINMNDCKRLYLHPSHKFYIGDIANEHFLKRARNIRNELLNRTDRYLLSDYPITLDQQMIIKT